jgi:hypothetical protein
MAYGSDIDALGNAHRYILSANANDSVGTNNGTNSGGVFTGSAICEDTTNSYVTNGVSDRIVLPSITTINNAAQSRKAVCGWFAATGIQNPPKNIYGEGNASQAFRFILGWGNYLVFEVDDPNFTIQIFGDVPLAVNRPYHLTMIFEGNGYANEVRAYLDGVPQLSSEPASTAPSAATLTARTAGEFGDPAGTVAVGGTAVILLAPINGQYAQWAMFDGANAVLTDTQVREELFEKGALADVTISSGTEGAMQTALDVYSTTTRGDAPCCIEVEAVTGGGDFTLDVDDITFSDLASIHIRYNGTSGTLTLRNTNGSNCSIISAPFGGAVEVFTEVDVTVTCLSAQAKTPIENARVLLETDPGGATVIDKVLTNSSGVATATYDFAANQAVTGRARKGSSSPYFKTAPIVGTITKNGFETTVLMLTDE